MIGTVIAADENGNGLNDLWEYIHGPQPVFPSEDLDGDGASNLVESAAGTDPFDRMSVLSVEINRREDGKSELQWDGHSGKQYTIRQSVDLSLDSWVELDGPFMARESELFSKPLSLDSDRSFFQLEVTGIDSDGDGLNDWEEGVLGFDPTRTRTDRLEVLDADRFASDWEGSSMIDIAVYDDRSTESWPEPAIIALRRSGALKPVTVTLAYSGTATLDADYTVAPSGLEITFGLGEQAVYLQIQAVDDAESGEAEESVTVTLQPGAGYVLGTTVEETVVLHEAPAPGLPSAKEAARFLIQAAFGPDQDSPEDADHLPENVEEVMAVGIEPWIDEQLTRPLGLHQPFVTWTAEQPREARLFNDAKQNAWWGRALGVPKLRPDAPDAEDQLPDPLRQRMAFALSQIFVISDRMEAIGVRPEGMAHYYDLFIRHGFGNYRDLLQAVSLHPCMGLYLSHLGNRKADDANNLFPDENFAREIMQLFSIGLWELNPDGTRKLDRSGNPIPTYDNADITEYARVFTGIAFGGGNTSFRVSPTDPSDFFAPMGAWDAEHDLEPKTLLSAITTPQRAASPGNTGTATLADIDAAIDSLFHHPNTGPFISRLLIQRFVTSNPSPDYIGRVAAVFNDPADRGNLGAVLKAILMDPEARDPHKRLDPTFGKAREPFLKCVNLARAFNASTETGWYYLDDFYLDHAQEPHKSPSVFNFFLPTYSPPGELAAAGLVAPEFQIITSTTGVMSANYFRQAIFGSFHRWGIPADQAERRTLLDLTQEMALNVPAAEVDLNMPTEALPTEPLVRRLDMALTGGTLEPENFEIICRALERIGPGSAWRWHETRLTLAIYLILTSPEFSIQR